MPAYLAPRWSETLPGAVMRSAANVVCERCAAQGEPDRLPRLIDELVAKRVDVIIPQGYTAAIAAKERAGNTPVVVTLSGGPVGTGLAASLSHPGGNITGV